MMVGDFREHREHGAPAQGMPYDRVYGRVLSQNFGQAVAESR